MFIDIEGMLQTTEKEIQGLVLNNSEANTLVKRLLDGQAIENLVGTGKTKEDLVQDVLQGPSI